MGVCCLCVEQRCHLWQRAAVKPPASVRGPCSRHVKACCRSLRPQHIPHLRAGRRQRQIDWHTHTHIQIHKHSCTHAHMHIHSCTHVHTRFPFLSVSLCLPLYLNVLSVMDLRCVITAPYASPYLFISPAPAFRASHTPSAVVNLHQQGCLLASAAFHLFLPHISEKAHARWFQLDLLGITFGMLGCYVPGVHFGFYCDPVRSRSKDVATMGRIRHVFLDDSLAMAPPSDPPLVPSHHRLHTRIQAVHFLPSSLPHPLDPRPALLLLERATAVHGSLRHHVCRQHPHAAAP